MTGGLSLSTEIVDRSIYDSAVSHLRDARVRLPTFSQLADPATIPDVIRSMVDAVDPQDPNAANLFRINWYNDTDRAGGSMCRGICCCPKN